jgi:L-fuconolactonase
MIDAHQHFWQPGRFDYPWMSKDLGILYRDYLPTDLSPILHQHHITKTVLVQASNSVAESRWLLELADSHDFIAGVVGWVDLKNLDDLSAHPKFKGVRHLVESEPNDDWLIQPSVLSGLQKLSAHNLSYDLLVHTRHLKHAPSNLWQTTQTSIANFPVWLLKQTGILGRPTISAHTLTALSNPSAPSA